MTSSPDQLVAGPGRRSDPAVPAPVSAGERESRALRRLYVVSVVAAMAPIVYAAAVALHRGYVPVGDNAFFAIRARDVFSHHIPLLGEATSVSQTAKLPFNNLGPLLFDAFAIPVAVFGSAAGLIVGVALLNCAAVLGVALVAYRRGGAMLGVVSMGVAAALCWAMGSQVLLDPTQPSSLVLPFLLFAMLIWSLTCGDLPVLPWAAGVASLILMSYVTYGYLVVLLSAWGVIGLVLWLRAERRTDGGSQSTTAQRIRRPVAVSGLVLALCWIQPVIEQFGRSGNATRLLRSLNDPGLRPIGYSVGARLVAKVVSLPPGWVRPSYGRYLAANQPGAANPSHSSLGPSTTPSLLLALASLTVLAGVLGWCAWSARRRGDSESGRAIVTAAVVVTAALVTAGRMPLGVFGFVTPHTFRWLWALAAFAYFAIALTVARFVRYRLKSRLRPVALASVLLLVTIVVGALNLPSSNQGALEDNSAIPAVRDLGRQLGALEGQGPILIVPPTKFHEPISEGVWAQMQRVGIPFVTDDPYELRHLGPTRKFTGTEARLKVFLVEGAATPVTTPGARRIAVHDGLTGRDRAALARLTGSLVEDLGRRGLPLTARGAQAVQSGQRPPVSTSAPVRPAEARVLLRWPGLAFWLERGYLSLDVGSTSRLRTYLALQQRQTNETVALYLAPVHPT